MVLKCLFLISDDISVYKQKGNELIPIKFKGDIFYKGDISEFMDWFEDKSGYIDGETKFDICVLKKQDNDIELDFFKYNLVEKTSWNQSEVSKFLMQKISKSNIKYRDKYFKVINNNKVIKGQNFVDFELSLYPDDDEFLIDKLTDNRYEKVEVYTNSNSKLVEYNIEKEESILSKYYRQKTLEISKAFRKNKK